MKRLASALPTLLAYALPITLLAIVVLFVLPGASPLQNGFVDNTFQNIIVPPTATPVIAPCLDPQSGDIAFESDFTGNRDIFLVNADGTGLCNLTRHPAMEQEASWSPDGTRIMFTSSRGDAGEDPRLGVMHVYVTPIEDAVDGKPPLGVARGTDPGWLSDGMHMVFQSRVDGRVGLYVANADGGNPIRVVDDLGSIRGSVVWSSMTSLSSPPACIVDLTGLLSDWANASSCLVISTSENSAMVWSPDGSQAAFVAAHDIWVVSREDARPLNLARGNGEFHDLAWSPDGSQIAFIHGADAQANYNIHVVNSDGSGMRRLTYTRGQDFGPQWSPDGRFLVYASHNIETDLIAHMNVYNIYIVNVATGEQTRLTYELSDDLFPVWRPRPISQLPATPIPEPVVTETPEPILTETSTPSETPTETLAPSVTPTLEPTLTETPDLTSTESPTETHTPTPSARPSEAPTATWTPPPG